jgi:hypothetical protein
MYGQPKLLVGVSEIFTGCKVAASVGRLIQECLVSPLINLRHGRKVILGPISPTGHRPTTIPV